MSERIRIALDKKNGGNQSEMARAIGVSPQAIQKWIAGASEPRGENFKKAAEFLGITEAVLRYGENGSIENNGNAKHFSVSEPTEEYNSTGAIEYWDAKGSCGGGFLNYEEMPKGHLVKESTFFRKYGLKPSNAFAIYADGNSMADFIVDGDIVIFDRSQTTPQSGKIFAIDHPDGLRIKMLRRDIDGSWILESTNADKRTYPDERITPEHAELLKIHGRFVYRQGG